MSSEYELNNEQIVKLKLKLDGIRRQFYQIWYKESYDEQFYKFIIDNIKQICNETDFPKKNGNYIFAFDDTYGHIYKNFELIKSAVQKYLRPKIDSFIDTNKDKIKSKIDINKYLPIIKEQLYTKMFDSLLYGLHSDKFLTLIEPYILEYLNQLNAKINDERIIPNIPVNKTGYMNWSPEDDNQRDAAIVIVHSDEPSGSENDKVINNDHVIFSEFGQSHSAVMKDSRYAHIFNNIQPSSKENMITRGELQAGFAYYINNVAFIDPKSVCTYSSINDILNILKQDSRIKKIYTLPQNKSGGYVVRLAYKIH